MSRAPNRVLAALACALLAACTATACHDDGGAPASGDERRVAVARSQGKLSVEVRDAHDEPRARATLTSGAAERQASLAWGTGSVAVRFEKSRFPDSEPPLLQYDGVITRGDESVAFSVADGTTKSIGGYLVGVVDELLFVTKEQFVLGVRTSDTPSGGVSARSIHALAAPNGLANGGTNVVFSTDGAEPATNAQPDSQPKECGGLSVNDGAVAEATFNGSTVPVQTGGTASTAAHPLELVDIDGNGLTEGSTRLLATPSTLINNRCNLIADASNVCKVATVAAAGATGVGVKLLVGTGICVGGTAITVFGEASCLLPLSGAAASFLGAAAAGTAVWLTCSGNDGVPQRAVLEARTAPQVEHVSNRCQALRRAQQFAQVPNKGPGSEPILMGDLRNDSRGPNWAALAAHGAKYLGRHFRNQRTGQITSEVFDHPDGHADDNAEHHKSPHIHAKNEKGEELIVTYNTIECS